MTKLGKCPIHLRHRKIPEECFTFRSTRGMFHFSLHKKGGTACRILPSLLLLVTSATFRLKILHCAISSYEAFSMGNGALDVDIDGNLTEVRPAIAVHGFNYRERDARNLNLLRAKYMSNCFHCDARHPVMRMALPLSCKIAETPMQCVSVKTRERRGRARARVPFERGK